MLQSREATTRFTHPKNMDETRFSCRKISAAEHGPDIDQDYPLTHSTVRVRRTGKLISAIRRFHLFKGSSSKGISRPTGMLGGIQGFVSRRDYSVGIEVAVAA